VGPCGTQWSDALSWQDGMLWMTRAAGPWGRGLAGRAPRGARACASRCGDHGIPCIHPPATAGGRLTRCRCVPRHVRVFVGAGRDQGALTRRPAVLWTGDGQAPRAQPEECRRVRHVCHLQVRTHSTAAAGSCGWGGVASCWGVAAHLHGASSSSAACCCVAKRGGGH